MASVLERDKLIEEKMQHLKDEIGIGAYAEEEIKKAMLEIWRDGYSTGVEENDE